MPNVRLTDLTVASLKPALTRVDYWDATLPTFGVRISPKGSKIFILKLRGGRRSLGKYPHIQLSEARGAAKRLLAEKTLGKVRPPSMSLQTALDNFLEEKTRSRRPHTVATLKQRLNQHFAFNGQLADFNHTELLRRLKKIPTNAEHDHALAAAKTFFTWAVNRRYIDDNPTRGISPCGNVARARVLTDDEVKKIWYAADQMGGHFGKIVKLLVLTGCRRNEIASLQTSWLDLENKTLTIPPSVTKNGREHAIPIGHLTASVSKSATTTEHGAFLFPARGGSGTCFNGWSKSKGALDRLSGVTAWTLHDLRRTYATRLADLGIAPHIIERLLNHASGIISGVAATYNRARYLPEMRAAIELWENRLRSVLDLL